MKTMIMTLALLVGLPLAASAQVTKEDLKKLSAAGISDEVILSYVRSNGGVAKMSADDIIELKQAGASEKLLSSVLGGVQAAPAPAVAPVERQVERQYVTQPRTTYVDSTPYYYTPTTYVDSYEPYYASYSTYAPYYSYPRSSYYYSSYYPRSYYSSYYSPRYYSSYCSPSLSFGWSSGRHTSSHIGVGVSVRRR